MYYAYNLPAGMTESDFRTMIDNETHGEVTITDVSINDNVATLTFEEPGYCAEWLALS